MFRMVWDSSQTMPRQARRGAVGRTARAGRTREGIADPWTAVLRHAGRGPRPHLWIRPQSVYRAAAQSQAAAAAGARL